MWLVATVLDSIVLDRGHSTYKCPVAARSLVFNELKEGQYSWEAWRAREVRCSQKGRLELGPYSQSQERPLKSFKQPAHRTRFAKGKSDHVGRCIDDRFSGSCSGGCCSHPGEMWW